jgi:hypothetical protein
MANSIVIRDLACQLDRAFTVSCSSQATVLKAQTVTQHQPAHDSNWQSKNIYLDPSSTRTIRRCSSEIIKIVYKWRGRTSGALPNSSTVQAQWAQIYLLYSHREWLGVNIWR